MPYYMLTDNDVKLLRRLLRITPSGSSTRDGDPSPNFNIFTYFELKEDLAADSTTGATAYKREWDGTAESGEGAYVTNTDLEFTVKDTRKVGYYGSDGAMGACIMKSAESGLFGEIVDMECLISTYFELKETLGADSTTGATAYRRNYDPSANGGEGGPVTDTNDEITVKDTREVGYYGSAGAKGACVMKTADNNPFGEIIDMECP